MRNTQSSRGKGKSEQTCRRSGRTDRTHHAPSKLVQKSPVKTPRNQIDHLAQVSTSDFEAHSAMAAYAKPRPRGVGPERRYGAAWELFSRQPKRRIGLAYRTWQLQGEGDITIRWEVYVSMAEAIVPYQTVSSGYPMVSVNFKLAILTVLAKWPDRRATAGEVRREVGIIIADEDQAERLRRPSGLGDIDIFQTGLVSRNREGFQITDAGLSLLQSLESSSHGPSAEVSTASASQPLVIDDLGSEERDLELRTLDNIPLDGNEHTNRQRARDEGNRAAAIEASGSASLIGADGLSERIDSEACDAGEYDDDDQPVQGEQGQPISIDAPRAAPDFPPFLQRGFGSRGQASGRKSLQLASLLAFISEKRRVIAGAWRRLFSETISNEKTERLVGSVGGAAFALLSLLAVVTCVGAAIALGQIKSLKSDVSVLHREVLSLRERLAKSEQAEKAKRDLDQQEEIKAEKNKPGGEIRADQTALNLSREEIQLIKDYIKPAPAAGAAAATINVGDPVEGTMIPLPSQLTDKVPKLVGGKFSIRNGAIIIVKRDSRQADAVLAPN
jgi:hypothetical protein